MTGPGAARSLRILVVGHGRMGLAVADAAGARGHRVTGFVSATRDGDHRRVSAALAAAAADVAIDFTHADAVDAVVGDCIDAKLPLVTGTTGWGDRLAAVRARVVTGDGTLLHAANFAIGVQLFVRTVGYAAELFARAGDHDVAVEERHHRGKQDAPSGTALAVANSILAVTPGKRRIVAGLAEGGIAADALNVAAVRLGTEFGSHAVIFDGPDDVIELRHTARSRRGFAAGAVRSAEWLVTSGRRGVLTIDDMLDDLLVAGSGRGPVTDSGR